MDLSRFQEHLEQGSVANFTPLCCRNSVDIKIISHSKRAKLISCEIQFRHFMYVAFSTLWELRRPWDVTAAEATPPPYPLHRGLGCYSVDGAMLSGAAAVSCSTPKLTTFGQSFQILPFYLIIEVRPQGGVLPSYDSQTPSISGH